MFKTIFIILMFLCCGNIFSSEEYYLREVVLSCPKGELCDEVTQKLGVLKGQSFEVKQLENVLKNVLNQNGVYRPEYAIYKFNNELGLKVSFESKKTIVEIELKSKNSDLNTYISLPVKVGDAFEIGSVELIKKRVASSLIDKGFPSCEVAVDVLEIEAGVKLVVKIEFGKPLVINEVQLKGVSEVYQNIFLQKLAGVLKKPLDAQMLKKYLNELKVYFVNFGHLLTNINYNVEKREDGKLILVVDSELGPLFTSYVRGPTIFTNLEISSSLREEIKTLKKIPTEEEIHQFLVRLYKEKGFLNIRDDIEIKNYEVKGVERAHANIVINENKKAELNELVFKGNVFFTNAELRKKFYDDASDLAARNNFDPAYYDKFILKIKEEYLSKGYLLADIAYRLVPLEDDVKFNLEFRFDENVQTLIGETTVDIGSKKLEKLILSKWEYKEGDPFNPELFDSNVDQIISLLQEKGYYFARLKKSRSQLIKYNRDGTRVTLHLPLRLGPKLYYRRIFFVGNYKTKERLLKRKVTFKEKALLKKSKLNALKQSLVDLGLFSSVKVEPLADREGKKKLVDVLVSVTERNYGAVEVAPGFRTDIGLKFSTKFSYQNIGGMNRSASALAQVNQRLNYFTLDPRRRNEHVNLLEYSLKLSYVESDIKSTGADYTAAVSSERRRFYSFDANILRNSHTISKAFSHQLSTSLRYQYETISQFDATSTKDSGNFQIGAITPGLTLDFRNSRVLPRKGAFLNFSCEYADPIFMSQHDENMRINFYKFVSRNRFYIPLGDFGVIATYLSFGMEKNLSTSPRYDSGGTQVVDSSGKAVTRGNIPSIKVFRLAGADIVRGFDETELNKLRSGQDISEYSVQNTAFMSIIKIEPRFFLSDDKIVGFFFDAGRVSVERYDPFDLRSSVGISFKYLTPVGTLDFDYGIKLLRKDLGNGTYESPGRLHISIGFF